LLQRIDVVAGFNRLAVDGEEHIPRPNARAAGRGAGIDLRRHHPRRPLHPQHAVLDVVLRGALHDVDEPEHE
jgi:hypothetical protein